MKSTEFCYWLQGYVELCENKHLNTKQFQVMVDHLALVFKHEIDPSYGSEEHTQELNDLHGGVMRC
jgi:hypothetical protein